MHERRAAWRASLTGCKPGVSFGVSYRDPDEPLEPRFEPEEPEEPEEPDEVDDPRPPLELPDEPERLFSLS